MLIKQKKTIEGNSDPIVDSAENQAHEPMLERQGPLMYEANIPQYERFEAPMPKTPIHSGHAQKTPRDASVKKILGIGLPNKVQEPTGSPSHGGIQDHTYSSPSPRSKSQSF